MKLIITFTTILVGIICGQSQGFINLNFESATFVTHPFGGSFVYATNAVPGWIPYLDGVGQNYIASNGVTLGGPMISIETTNNPQAFAPVQGKYFIFLQGGTVAGPYSAGIGQTAQISISTQSLIFWGVLGGMQISFNSQALLFAAIGTTGSYTIYGADVSPFAGQTGELLFTTPAQTGGILDNIQFSSSPVPEPSILGLFTLGSLLLACKIILSRETVAGR